MPPPAACPKCNAADSFTAVGPGVERLQEEAAALFPEARTMVLSSDLVVSVDRLREELAEIGHGLHDIVIGTQLVAKGHHFPKLNLVGVVDADLGLSNGDPRAAERTFQLLHQVAGRAGREEGRGHGFLQTHQPEHPVIRALLSGNREEFYSKEIEDRERFGYPPFGRLASIIVSGPDRHAAEGFARQLAVIAPRDGRRAPARPRRSAARARAGPLPLPAAGEIAAHVRSLGLAARVACERAQAQEATSSSKWTSTRRVFCERGL